MAGIGGDLEVVFGGPSDDGFGSAVFRRSIPAGDDLEQSAKSVYRDFAGEMWDRFGAAAWLGTWAELSARSHPSDGPVLDLLGSLEDPLALSSADVLVNGGSDPEAARRALVGVFDREQVSDLRIYRIGDGDAMSGLLIAALDSAAAAVFLVFMMD